MPTRILIIDDHPIVRQGLRSLLSNHPQFEVVAEAASVADGLREFDQTRAEVTLLDIRLAGESGLDLLEVLLGRDPAARVVVVSSFDDDEYVTRALRTGALGYVLKADSPQVLVSVIERVAAGERALSPQVSARLLRHLLGESDLPGLDSLEVRLLTLLSRGLSNAQIAEELYLSDTTVKRRLRVVFTKLGVSKRAEAVGVAIRRGLV